MNGIDNERIKRPESLLQVRQKKRKKLFKTSLFIVTLLSGTLLILIYLCINYLFVISEIDVSVGGIYTPEDIREAVGITAGMRLFEVDEALVEETLLYNMPYITGVKVKKLLPSTLKIEVKIDTGTFYLVLGDDIFIISENMRVLEKREDLNSDEYAGMIKINTDAVRRCFVGDEIEFTDMDIPIIIKDFYNIIKSNRNADAISEIDILNKFNVILSYGSRFIIKLGNFTNMAIKYRFALDIIDELKHDDKGTITIINEKDGSFTPFFS